MTVCSVSPPALSLTQLASSPSPPLLHDPQSQSFPRLCLCWLLSVPQLHHQPGQASLIHHGASSPQLRPGELTLGLCLDPPSPLLHLSPWTSRLHLGFSPSWLHLGPPSLQLLWTPLSCQLYLCCRSAIAFSYSSGYTSSLNPYVSVRLLLPCGPTSVPTQNAVAAVLQHPCPTSATSCRSSTSVSWILDIAGLSSYAASPGFPPPSAPSPLFIPMVSLRSSS